MRPHYLVKKKKKKGKGQYANTKRKEVFSHDHIPWYEDAYALATTIGLDMDANFYWLLLKVMLISFAMKIKW